MNRRGQHRGTRRTRPAGAGSLGERGVTAEIECPFCWTAYERDGTLSAASGLWVNCSACLVAAGRMATRRSASVRR